MVADIYCVVSNNGSVPSLTSGYRNPAANYYISTSQGTQYFPDSRHVYGDGVDLGSSNHDQYQNLRDIAKAGSCGTACVEPEPVNHHTHIDYRPNRAN